MPHLEPLKDVFNFTIESQILYHAPLSFTPSFGQQNIIKRDVETLSDGQTDGDTAEIVKDKVGEEEEAWQVTEEDMKIFVNSERWSLGMLRSRTLK